MKHLLDSIHPNPEVRITTELNAVRDEILRGQLTIPKVSFVTRQRARMLLEYINGWYCCPDRINITIINTFKNNFNKLNA